MSTLTSPKVAFILQIKVTFDPKDREEFLKHFNIIFPLVSAEPEIAYLVVGEDASQPGTFRWTEGWTKDVEWFMANQINKPYYKPYLEATEPLFTSPRVAEICIPIEGCNFFKTNV